MHEIYANSACNIAASASRSPDGGLFRSREAKDALVGYVKFDFPGDNAFDIWDQFYMDRLTQGPLSDRGWVFQERLLSPRVLHFARTQIVWECFDMDKCEMFPGWSPYPTEARISPRLKTKPSQFESGSSSGRLEQYGKKMDFGLYDHWIHLVNAYSRCSLTYPDDRLIAMSGIAEMFKENTGDEYLAGLWKSRLTEGLNWVVVDPVARPQNHLRAPSWSWAAVDSAVSPQQRRFPAEHGYLVEVINATVESPDTAAGWHQIRGSIDLRVCLSKAAISECMQRGPRGENIELKLVDLPSGFWAYPDTTDTTFEDGKILHLLPLRTTLWSVKREDGTKKERLYGVSTYFLEGMIIELVSAVNTCYRRVGRFIAECLDDMSFFGLLVISLDSSMRLTKVVMDDTQTSCITLV
jgi:hypothetical protein